MGIKTTIRLLLHIAAAPALLLVQIGCAATSSDDAEFDLPMASQAIAGRAPGLGMDTPLAALMADPAAKAILVTYDPDLALSSDVGLARECSLNFLSRFPQTGLTPATMTKIDLALRQLRSHKVSVRP